MTNSYKPFDIPLSDAPITGRNTALIQLQQDYDNAIVLVQRLTAKAQEQAAEINAAIESVVELNVLVNKQADTLIQQADEIERLKLEVAARDRVLILQEAWKMAKCDKCSYPHTQECGYDRGCINGMIAFAKADIEKE